MTVESPYHSNIHGRAYARLDVPLPRHPAVFAVAARSDETAADHPKDRLRRLLFEVFALPFIALGLGFSPGIELPAPPAQSISQTWSDGSEKAAATQRMDDAIRQHSSPLGNPEDKGQPPAATAPFVVQRLVPMEHYPQLVQDHRDAIADPDAKAKQNGLHEAIGAALDAHEKLVDNDEAVKFVIDWYAVRERQRTGKESPEGVKIVRKWQELR
jgi:hypothetical protein